jgi:hypothetical protein
MRAVRRRGMTQHDFTRRARSSVFSNRGFGNAQLDCAMPALNLTNTMTKADAQAKAE